MTAETLSTIKKIKLIDKKEFAIATLDKNAKIFVIYVATLLMASTIQVHLFC